MFKENGKRKKLKTWDEAFRALTPAMRQHSVRVADYTQVLFAGVCKASSYILNPDSPVYVDEAYTDIAYKCGFFHQIGKALHAQKYERQWDELTEEEKLTYCEYTVDGRDLAEKLQGEYGDEDSLPGLMIQDACEQHMEYWNGEGYPNGCVGERISLIAQIVGLAKELDRLVCERKSETPFEDAFEGLLTQEGRMFSAELLEVFRTCRAELRAIYKKYINYTKVMPKTVPLVEKRPERPFGLNYRQIVLGEKMQDFLFEAVPWFGAVLDAPEEKEPAVAVEDLLRRAGMIGDITLYFLYEAADALARMKNCELNTGGVLVPVFDGFYSGKNQADRLEQLYRDSGIDKKKLLLSVQEGLLKKERSAYERLKEYASMGVSLLLDNYHPDTAPVELILEIGFTHVRMAKDSLEQDAARERIQKLRNQGITVVDWPSGDTWLSEDELIRYLLKFE